MQDSLEQIQDLSDFRSALSFQFEERIQTLKRAVDEEMADIITARRMEVEGIVYRLRRAAAQRLNDGLRANRRYGERRAKAGEVGLRSDLMGRLEARISEGLRDFRRTSPREYEEVLRALAEEASEGLESPLVALVEKGDAGFLKGRKEICDICEVREELEDVWGGLVLVEAGKGESRLVDNTFRTRWRRLYPAFLEEFRECFELPEKLSFAER